MSSLNTLADRLRGKLSSYNYSQNFLSRNLMKDMVVKWRAVFLRRDIDKNSFIPDIYYQTIPCLKVVCAEDSECQAFGCTDGFFNKIEKEIPEPLRLKNFAFMPMRISSSNQVFTIPLVQLHEVAWLNNNAFTANESRAFRRGKHIYLYNAQGMENVTVTSVFPDPRKLQIFDDLDGNPVYTDDDNFPFPEDMEEGFLSAIVENEMNAVYSVPNNNPKEELAKQNGTTEK